MASRSPRRGSFVRCLLATVLLFAVGVGLGCSAWRGARLYQSGTNALRQGDVDASVSDLERAAELVPHASEVQNHLGLAYEADGRETDALAAFERAVDLDCDNVAAQTNLSRLRGELPSPLDVEPGGLP